jgi:hypothetical protein
MTKKIASLLLFKKKAFISLARISNKKIPRGSGSISLSQNDTLGRDGFAANVKIVMVFLLHYIGTGSIKKLRTKAESDNLFAK